MQRAELLQRLRQEATWDLVVVGGGATGLGTAVDAAARGYKTLLLEAYDFAKGTSSRSTKLIHGGVRYLAQGNIGLVREALHERGRLVRNAPHLVHPLGFVVPAYRWWDRPFYGIGLKIYDLLAGRLNIGSSRIISRSEALRLTPTLESKGLRGGVLYYDGQFDDARMSVALLRTLLDLGGTALNYLPITGMLKSNGRVSGVKARDLETGEEFAISAGAVVNATGVYVDAVRKMDDEQASPVLSPSQGVHIVLDQEFLPGENAIMIPRTDDGRVLFAIPWHGKVLVGTTDTPVNGLPLEPRALEQEIRFLLEHAARYMSKDPRREDVRSIFAGLRPLVKADAATSTAALSREHTLLVSRSGLITITGGKWTTYRRMGLDAVNKAIEVAGLPSKPSATEELRLHGWQAQVDSGRFAIYGADAAALSQLVAEQPAWSAPLHPRLPYVAGEVIWAARFELARSVEDVLARRTRALLLDARASIQAAPRVAELLAAELGCDQHWQETQVAEFRELAEGYLL